VRKRIIVTVLMLLLLPASLYADNKALISEAITAVRESLRDPYSARFRNLHVGKISKSAVFGEVNGKNGYGGYTGFTKFYYGEYIGYIVSDRKPLFFQTPVTLSA